MPTKYIITTTDGTPILEDSVFDTMEDALDAARIMNMGEREDEYIIKPIEVSGAV